LELSSETATAADTVFGVFALGTGVAESAAASETVASRFSSCRVGQTATAADVVSSLANVNSQVSGEL
jgi:triphosphoribosyl-dephospho-CoA synthetase